MHVSHLNLCAALFFSACSTTTIAPVDRHHAASTDAPEARARPLRPMLGADDATQRTHDLIARREREAKAAEAEPPGNEANIATPKQKPTGHEHHQ